VRAWRQKASARDIPNESTRRCIKKREARRQPRIKHKVTCAQDFYRVSSMRALPLILKLQRFCLNFFVDSLDSKLSCIQRRVRLRRSNSLEHFFAFNSNLTQNNGLPFVRNADFENIFPIHNPLVIRDHIFVYGTQNRNAYSYTSSVPVRPLKLFCVLYLSSC